MISIEHILKIQAYLAAGVGLIPVLPFLGSWVLAVLFGAFSIGIVTDVKKFKTLSEPVCTLLSIVFFLLFIAHVSLADLATPLLEFLCLLLAVRLAGPKTARYLLQIFLLASMILAGSSMLVLDPGYLIYLVIIIFLVTTGLVFLSFSVTDPTLRFSRGDWRYLTKAALLLPVGSLLLMVFFFLILPRTQTPLWNFLNPETRAVTGISDQVKPGPISDLTADTTLVFRAETTPMPPEQLYWRAIVFSRLEGQSWHHEAAEPQEKVSSAQSPPRMLTFYAEPKSDVHLPALDRPVKILNAPGNWITLHSDGALQLRRPNDKKYRYDIQVQTDAQSVLHGNRQKYLQLPDRLSERTRQEGQRLAQNSNFSAKVSALNQFFHSQKLSYSTTRLPVTADPIDTFLYVNKRGYCEYFASSYAILLRLAGVPTRLVGGYLGGDYNELGGYYLITQDQAHVWVEALNDEGIWQRIDPSRLAINSTEAFQLAQRTRISSLSAVIDVLEHHWSQFVINYDLRQQFALIKSLLHVVKELPNIKSSGFFSIAWVASGAGILLLYLGWRRWQQPHKNLLRSYLKAVAKMNYPTKFSPSTGLYDLAEQTQEPLCQRFAEIYGQAIYQNRRPTSEERTQLRQIIRHLKSKQQT